MLKREKKAPAGVPGWVVTFADLMSLLLTFFILLLSFSTTSKPKFKSAMGSVKEALGVKKSLIYKQQLSSNNPLKDRVNLDPLRDENYMVKDQILSANSNQFCELEEDRKLKEKEYVKQVFSAVAEKIQKTPLIKAFFKVNLEQEELNITVNEQRMFKAGGSSLGSSAKVAMKAFFKVLPKESLDISVVNHLKINEASDASMEKWMSANSRSFNLIKAAYQIPEARRHEIIVKSGPVDRIPSSILEDGDMALNIKFKNQN